MLNGYKDTMMEYFNFLSTVFIIIILLALGSLMIQVSANTGFSNHVEGIVSRHGGLTQPAITEIDAYSKTYYGERYDVMGVVKDGKPVYTMVSGKITPTPQAKQAYGTRVEFAVKAHFRLLFFDLPMDMDLRVVSVTRRR